MRTKEEILKQVDEVMEEYVAPNVAQHGGQINILNFNEETGILHTQ
jgi:Fe-S cluster biogenesis protein NfuA